MHDRVRISLTTIVILLTLSHSAWGKVYTLQELLQTVLKTNEQIEIAKAKVGQMSLLPWRAMARVAPQLYVNGTLLRQTSISNALGTVVPREQRNYAAILKWPIWQFEILSRISQGNSLIDGAKEELRGVVQDVTYAATSAYLEYLKAKQLKSVADEFMKQAAAHQKIAASRFKIGETRKTALLQAELDVIHAEKRLIEAEHGVEIGKAALRSFVPDLPEDLEVEEWEKTASGEAPITTLPKTLALAEKHRPDLRALQHQTQAAEADYSAATMRLFPTLSIDASYQTVDPATFFSADHTTRVSGTVSIPIFQGGEEWLSRADYDLQAKQAKLRLASRKKEAEIEVRRAYLQWEASKRSRDAAEKGAELAQENYRLVEKSFREGLTGSTDLTDAHTTLMEAEFSKTTENYNLYLATLSLQKATGTLNLNL